MNREQALLRLTDRQRTLIRLRDHEKLTWAKIGEALGVGGQYAAQLHKAAVKELAKLEATPEPPSDEQKQDVHDRVIELTGDPQFAERLAPSPKVVISRGEPAATQPKVVVIRGIPVPQTTTVQRHWSSVTIRA